MTETNQSINQYAGFKYDQEKEMISTYVRINSELISVGLKLVVGKDGFLSVISATDPDSDFKVRLDSLVEGKGYMRGFKDAVGVNKAAHEALNIKYVQALDKIKSLEEKSGPQMTPPAV